MKEATLHQPPNTLLFDHISKKPRREPLVKSALQNVQQPTIHVTVNNHQDRRLTENPPVTYAPVAVVLREMQELWPDVNILQYQDPLAMYNILFVNIATVINRAFFIDIIGMPSDVADEFLSRATWLTHQAEWIKFNASM